MSANSLRSEPVVRRPHAWSGGVLLRAVPAGIGALALHGIFGLVHWYTWGAYAVIGLSVSLFARGGDLLMRALAEPLIDGARPGVKFLSGVPFWFFSGGCGYTAGMLVAKKFFLLGFYDTPVKPMFLLGGVMGCVLQMTYEAALFRKTHGDVDDPR